MKLWHAITLQSKRNSKLIKHLNGGAVPLNLLRKTRLKPLWLKPLPVLFGSTSQSNVKSNKGQQKDFSDLKSICTANESLKERNSQPLEWGKKFATHFKNKEFLSRTCKQLMQLSVKRNNQPDRKTGQRSKYLSEEGRQMAMNHMKRCSGWLLEKCHSKLETVISSHSSEWPSLKRSTKIKCCRWWGNPPTLWVGM